MEYYLLSKAVLVNTSGFKHYNKSLSSLRFMPFQLHMPVVFSLLKYIV